MRLLIHHTHTFTQEKEVPMSNYCHDGNVTLWNKLDLHNFNILDGNGINKSYYGQLSNTLTFFLHIRNTMLVSVPCIIHPITLLLQYSFQKGGWGEGSCGWTGARTVPPRLITINRNKQNTREICFSVQHRPWQYLSKQLNSNPAWLFLKSSWGVELD